MKPPFPAVLEHPAPAKEDRTFTIVLVEDSDVDAFLFSSCLGRSELSGSTLIVAHNLQEATDVLTREKDVDAVFLDLNLPDSEGIDTLKAILPRVGARPVIIISGASDQALIRSALRVGAQDYLVKGSYDPVRLEHALVYSMERRRVTAQLQRTQENYETLFQNNPLPAWLFRPASLQIIMVNDAAVRHYGYSRDEFSRMTIRDLRTRDDLSRFDEFARSDRSDTYNSVGRVWTHRKKGGMVIDVEISAQTVTVNGEQLVYVVVHDVTERNRIMSLLTENGRRLDLAVNAGRMMVLDVDYAKSKIHVLSNAQGILGYPVDLVADIQAGIAFVHEDDREKIDKALDLGRSGIKPDLQFRILHPVNKAVIWVERRSYFVYGDDGLPLESRGVLVDITALKQYEEELSQSRANLLSIFESTEDSYVLVDADYRILALNRKSRQDFPYLRIPGILGKSMLSCIPEHRRDHLRNALEKVRAVMQLIQYEAVYENTSDGSKRYFQVRVTPVVSEGLFLGYTICGHDITAHKRIQQELTDREERFRSLIENSGDMFTITDALNRVVYASPNIEKILRYPVDELVGKPFVELLHRDDRPYYTFVLEQASRNKGKLFQKSCRMLTGSGEELWSEGTIVDLGDIPSIGGTVTNFRDITEKVNAQRELNHNRYILDKANEVTKIGYWVSDLNSHHALAWSPQLLNIFGVRESDLKSTPAFFESFIHDGDRDNRCSVLRSAMDGGREYSIDYRIIRSDGQSVWVNERAEVFFNNDKPAFVVGVVQDVTERKLHEQKIRESKNNLDALINNSSDILWSCDKALRLVSANKAFHEQVRPANGPELREGDMLLFLPEMDPLMMLWKNRYETALSGTRVTFETEQLYADGRVYFQNTLNPIWDGGEVVGVSGFSRDITESKKFENQIRAVNERFEILSKATNDAVWDWDMVRETLTWNHGLKSIYGHEPANRQTSFQWWKDMVHPDDLEFVTSGLQQAFHSRAQLWSCNYRFKCADGSYRHALDRGFILYEDAEPIRMIGALQDVNELIEYRMSLEQKVLERTTELQQALENEKHLSQMKSRFVSIASHEFRTPLSTIQFATDFLYRYKHKLGPGEIDKKLNNISSQVQHMMFLLDDVLTVAKGDSGKIQVNLSPLNMREFLFEMVRNVKDGSGAQHEIDVRVELQSDIVTLDEKLLVNILTNLLSNAIKFSPGGKTIAVLCAQSFGKMIIEVADNGIGVNEHEKETIFEPFSRGADVGAISGTGLGLSIVKTAVKLLQGTIDLYRTEAFRTVFRVEIPLP